MSAPLNPTSTFDRETLSMVLDGRLASECVERGCNVGNILAAMVAGRWQEINQLKMQDPTPANELRRIRLERESAQLLGMIATLGEHCGPAQFKVLSMQTRAVVAAGTRPDPLPEGLETLCRSAYAEGVVHAAEDIDSE